MEQNYVTITLYIAKVYHSIIAKVRVRVGLRFRLVLGFGYSEVWLYR